MAFIPDTGRVMESLAALSVHTTTQECTAYVLNSLITFSLGIVETPHGRFIELSRLDGDRVAFQEFTWMLADKMGTNYARTQFKPLPFPADISDEDDRSKFDGVMVQLREPNPDAALYALLQTDTLTEARADDAVPLLLKIAETPSSRLLALSALLKVADFATLDVLRTCVHRISESIARPTMPHERREAMRVALDLAHCASLLDEFRTPDVVAGISDARASPDMPAQKLARRLLELLQA